MFLMGIYFFFQNFSISSHSLWPARFLVSSEKSADKLMISLFYVAGHFLLLLSKFFVLTFGNLVLMFYCVVFFGLILLWLTGFLEYGCAISYVPWRHFQSLYFHISFLTQNFSQFPPPGTHVICVFVQLMMPYKSLEFLCFSSFYFLSVPLIELFQMTCIRIH